jgi:hypothetical protein
LLGDARDANIDGRSNMSKAELVEALEKHANRETARARGEEPNQNGDPP